MKRLLRNKGLVQRRTKTPWPLVRVGALAGIVGTVVAVALREYADFGLWTMLGFPFSLGTASALCLGTKERWTFSEGAVSACWATLVTYTAQAIVFQYLYPGGFEDIVLFLGLFAIGGFPAVLIGIAVATGIRNAFHDCRFEPHGAAALSLDESDSEARSRR